MRDNLIVVYLCYYKNNFTHVDKFINNYKKYKSGINHNLLICFKNLDHEKIIFLKKKFKKIKYNFVIDNFGDYDIGSYFRLAKKYKKKNLFFVGSYSYPAINNWLKIIYNNFANNTLISSAGSYQSLTSDAFNNSYRYNNNFIYNFLLRIIFFLKNLIYFPIFPNPHVRTNSFLIKAKDLLKYPYKLNYKRKFDCWRFESGRHSLTNFFKKKRFNIIVVNSKSNIFNKNSWKYSDTYFYKEQKSIIIKDKHTDLFNNSNKRDKLKLEKMVWGSN